MSSFLSLCHRVQVIPVNANGVPIGEIPFVRSGLLGFVGPVSGTVSLQYNICGNMSLPGNLPFLLRNYDPTVSLALYRAVWSLWWGRLRVCWWWADEDTMLTTWWPLHLPWSQSRLCTEGGEEGIEMWWCLCNKSWESVATDGAWWF